jgi:hypothetical protein
VKRGIPVAIDVLLFLVVSMTPEPFVSADIAAQFLAIKRRYLLALARRGIAGAYAIGTGSIRRVWVFRLSELAAAIARSGDPQNVKTVRSSVSGSLRAEKRSA